MAQDKAIKSMRLCNIFIPREFRIALFWQKRRASTGDHRLAKKERVKYDELRLRKSGDRRSDVIVKREMLHRIDETKVLFVVEDRNRVVEMWRKEGLVCLQCAVG
jgi:hypothetical protein